jgi:hypothetical protein
VKQLYVKQLYVKQLYVKQLYVKQPYVKGRAGTVFALYYKNRYWVNCS